MKKLNDIFMHTRYRNVLFRVRFCVYICDGENNKKTASNWFDILVCAI